MGLKYEDLEELCETVGQKITEANDKIRMSNGDLTGGDIDYVDKLTHTLKSIKTTMAMMDSEGYSHDGGYGMSGNYGRGGNSGRYYPYYSGARGRGAKRDSMGRYSKGRGYSGDDDMIEQLHELMEQAPDDRTRQEFQKFISKVENM